MATGSTHTWPTYWSAFAPRPGCLRCLGRTHATERNNALHKGDPGSRSSRAAARHWHTLAFWWGSGRLRLPEIPSVPGFGRAAALPKPGKEVLGGLAALQPSRLVIKQ